MNRGALVTLALLILSALMLPARADTTWVAGDVFGEWTSAGNPYMVSGMVVPAGQQLVIHEGVTIKLLGHSAITVYGIIYAEGESTELISFSRDGCDSTVWQTGWSGIHLMPGSGPHVFDFCVIRHGTAGGQFGVIRADSCIFKVIDSVIGECFRNAGISAYGRCEVTILRTEFYRCHAGGGSFGGGIRIAGTSSAIIDSCWIHDCTAQNGGGLCVEGTDPSATVTHTRFENNSCPLWGGAVHCSGTKNIFDHCVFWNNKSLNSTTGAIDDHTDTLIVDFCTFAGNWSENSGSGVSINSHGTTGYYSVTNSIFAGGGRRSPTYCITDYCDYFGNALDPMNETNAIYEDPEFADPEQGDFHLTAESPCIDAGHPDWPPDPDGTRADIGAFYYHQVVSAASPNVELPNSIKLLPAYPNPFNSETLLRFEVPAADKIRLALYDVLGRQVAVVYDGVAEAGVHEMSWTPASRSSGIYFAVLVSGESHRTQKLIFLK